jgi:hypothetical protein
MIRKYPSVVVGTLLVLGVVGWNVFVAEKVDAQGNRNYPAFTLIGGPALQITLQAGSGPNPSGGPGGGGPNSVPVYLFAQLVRNPSIQPPFTQQVQTLAGYTLSGAGGNAQPFTQDCTASTSTMIQCKLTPTGATWSAGGPIVARLTATDQDGFEAVSLVQFRVL